MIRFMTRRSLLIAGGLVPAVHRPLAGQASPHDYPVTPVPLTQVEIHDEFWTPRIEANRRHLREHGYVVACGLWSPHINGVGVPMWSPQYQTYVVTTIGLLSAMYDEKRLHAEVAPQMIELGAAIGSLLEGAEGDIFSNRIERKSLPVTAHNNNKIIKTEALNELEAGARRPRPARSIRAGDGRR